MNFIRSNRVSGYICNCLFVIVCLCAVMSPASAQFAPVVGATGTTALAADSTIFVGWATGCTIQRGYRDIAAPDSGYASLGDYTSAIGPATQNGIVSLGDGGKATLTFASPIVDGPGFDFAVFENGFDFGGPGMAFLELAFVEVSSDGQRFVRFPATDNVQDSAQLALEPMDGSLLNNLAGKYIYGYGTPFDLNELRDSAGLDIQHITHVRVVDVVGTIDPAFATHDSRGRIINDPYPTNYASSGFDLDAVGVIHQLSNGITDLNGAEAFDIYPNPTSQFISIRNNNNASHFSITDLSGREMMNGICGQNKKIDVSDLDAGLYFMNVVNEGLHFSKIMIKQ